MTEYIDNSEHGEFQVDTDTDGKMFVTLTTPKGTEFTFSAHEARQLATALNAMARVAEVSNA